MWGTSNGIFRLCTQVNKSPETFETQDSIVHSICAALKAPVAEADIAIHPIESLAVWKASLDAVMSPACLDLSFNGLSLSSLCVFCIEEANEKLVKKSTVYKYNFQ